MFNLYAQLELLKCEQLYEYEIQLLLYIPIHTSYLMLRTLISDCGITTLFSYSWKRLWLTHPLVLSPALNWLEIQIRFHRHHPLKLEMAKQSQAQGQRGTPPPPPPPQPHLS